MTNDHRKSNEKNDETSAITSVHTFENKTIPKRKVNIPLDPRDTK